MWYRAIARLAAIGVLVCPADALAGTELFFDRLAPAALVSRVRAIDLEGLAADLDRVGLVLPARLNVSLIAEKDGPARDVPPWVVALALEPSDIVIFHERVLRYPYDSLESVFRHEVAHLALSQRAGGRSLPRWLHEGLATVVDRGWGTDARLQLLLDMAGNPAMANLARLFASGTRPDADQAYRLSSALVADLQRRHGTDVAGRIAARVADGTSFPFAFEQETGVTPDEAASRAWRGYRRWTMWLSAVTSEAATWGAIVTLAIVASIVQMRRRAHRRRRWDEVEATESDSRPPAEYYPNGPGPDI